MNTHQPVRHAKKLYFAALLFALLLAAAAGAWRTVEAQASKSAAPASAYQTTTVRKGSLALTVSGTGKTSASQTVDLAFSSAGTLAELNAQPGQQVQAGETLASLDTIARLEQALEASQLAERVAQQTLDELKASGPANLAQALADRAAAQAALADAQDHLLDPHDWRCPDEVTAAYYATYLNLMVEARPWQALLEKATEVQKMYYLEHLNPILKKMELAYLNYQYCQAYTSEEITASQANLQSAQANLASAEAVYATLQHNGGIDPAQLAEAEAALTDAQLQRAKAQSNLSGARLSAPIDGVITAVNASLGQTVGTATLISIANINPLRVVATLDETDLANVAVGCSASVSFSSLNSQTFSARVSAVNPSLVQSGGVSMLQVTADFDNALLQGQSLPIGATAALTVTCQQVQDALYIPAQALYSQSGASSYVYILNAQGQPEKISVETGLNTGVSVQILSGLQEGDKIITSQVKP